MERTVQTARVEVDQHDVSISWEDFTLMDNSVQLAIPAAEVILVERACPDSQHKHCFIRRILKVGRKQSILQCEQFCVSHARELGSLFVEAPGAFLTKPLVTIFGVVAEFLLHIAG